MIEKYDEISPVYDALGDGFIKSLEPAIDAFEQIEKGLDDVALLSRVHDSVRLYGVTEALCTDMAQTMWDKFEFDLEAFKGAKNTSLHYCTEGISTTIKNILISIKNFFDKILKWLLTDSPFREYLNLMTYYYSYTSTKFREARNNIAFIDPVLFSKQICCGYSRDRYLEILTALIETVYVFKNMNNVDDLNKINETINTLNTTLSPARMSIGVKTDKGYVIQDEDNIGIRSDTMAVLGFTPADTTTNIYDLLHGRLLCNARTLIDKRFFVIKTIRECERSINKCLDQENIDEEQLKYFKIIKVACNGIKNIIKVCMLRSVQLAVQYCRIVDAGARSLRKTY